MKKTTRRGFTLIELLVVISIVSLLSSVVLAAIQSARVKADDTQRNQIVGEYVKALALFLKQWPQYFLKEGARSYVPQCVAY